MLCAVSKTKFSRKTYFQMPLSVLEATFLLQSVHSAGQSHLNESQNVSNGQKDIQLAKKGMEKPKSNKINEVKGFEESECSLKGMSAGKLSDISVNRPNRNAKLLGKIFGCILATLT